MAIVKHTQKYMTESCIIKYTQNEFSAFMQMRLITELCLIYAFSSHLYHILKVILAFFYYVQLQHIHGRPVV